MMERQRENAKETIVVVGNGMVGQRFCALLRDSRGSQHHRLVVFGAEPRPAYDRVHLTEYFSGKSAQDLEIAPPSWYRDNDIRLFVGEEIVAIDRAAKRVRSSSGRESDYDSLVLATGSAPFVPPLAGIDQSGVFVYRTIEDLDAIRAYARSSHVAAVIGGGLLGLEAAKALYDLGLITHVVEAAPWLMPRQLDRDGADLLAGTIRGLGVHIHCGKRTKEITATNGHRRFVFDDGSDLAADMIVVSAGIRPRDELAVACGLERGPRGGIAVNAAMRTSDPDIFAIGECASHDGTVYGLVGPGFEMADVAAAQLAGYDKVFKGSDLSTKLKLLGVDVASIGESTATQIAEHTHVAVRDEVAGVYKKLIIRKETNTLIGAVLVGDTTDFARLLQLFRRAEPLPSPPLSLIVDGSSVGSRNVDDLAGDCLLCTCNNVTKDDVVGAVTAGAHTMAAIQACTKAATGCGGCAPQVKQLLEAELRRAGVQVQRRICEHFPFRREELFSIVKIRGYRRFAEVLANHGSGPGGCEVCKPVVASILASIHAEPAIEQPAIQDTNDRFLANIQRGGTYSVVPRIPGGEITPEKLIALGEVARKYDLYLKITGGQRIDMFGARLEQLPDIWEELVGAGFESGHAYAKAMRTVKSCVGSTWCRYGVLDSVAFAIRIEERYKGLRAPHKLKAAVSGCIRECAEARSKDFGIIATAEGWNLYVCGNGGAKPRHGLLLAAGLDDDTCIRYVDRFLMYYIRTADPLTRTARWFEELDGGIDYLRSVIIDDHLGVCEQLDRDMQAAADGYQCEWAAVVKDPEKRRLFRAFVNDPGGDPTIEFVSERSQKRPASGGGLLSLPVTTPPVHKGAHA
jgi:nitrite reductase (NADH) large subunit